MIGTWAAVGAIAMVVGPPLGATKSDRSMPDGSRMIADDRVLQRNPNQVVDANGGGGSLTRRYA